MTWESYYVLVFWTKPKIDQLLNGLQGRILNHSQKSFELRLHQMFLHLLVMVSGRIYPNIGIPGSKTFSQPKQGKWKTKNSTKNPKSQRFLLWISIFAQWVGGPKILLYKLVLSKMRYFVMNFHYLIRILTLHWHIVQYFFKNLKFFQKLHTYDILQSTHKHFCGFQNDSF